MVPPSRIAPPAATMAAVLLIASCSGRVSGEMGVECSDGLKTAYAEIEDAKAKGLGSSMSIIKADALLTAASVQKEFEKFPNCIDKVRRARAYINDAKR